MEFPEFVGGKAGIPSLSASEVTLSGLAGGEYLPLPVSKGPAFPSLLTLDGYPTSPADFVQEHRPSPAKPTISCAISMLQTCHVENPVTSRQRWDRDIGGLSDYGGGTTGFPILTQGSVSTRSQFNDEQGDAPGHRE